MILDVRGTNGSGKSWIAHQLIREYNGQPVMRGGQLVGYCCSDLHLGIVGTYENKCGGCDKIKTADLIEQAVRWFASRYQNVLFESIRVSHTYKRYAELADDLKPDQQYVFAFLNTPLETCISRVVARRAEKGKHKPLNTKWLVSDFERAKRVCKRLADNGYTTVEIDYRRPLQDVLGVLRDANSSRQID